MILAQAKGALARLEVPVGYVYRSCMQFHSLVCSLPCYVILYQMYFVTAVEVGFEGSEHIMCRVNAFRRRTSEIPLVWEPNSTTST